MASVWGELKRRNVVRVAVAYAVVSWLILQLTDVLIPILALPEWVGRLVFLILLVGFPLAMIFAWAFELTPEGLKKEKDVDRSKSVTHVTGRKLDFIIIGVLAAGLIFFAVDKYFRDPDTSPGADSTQEIVANEIQRSIAVLPFVNMSSDPEQEYFSDGLSEEILNLLAKIPELKVIGRTSSFAFKGKNEDLRIIGEALGVKTVLEGSVRKSGDRVRITAQLIDVADGAHMWSATYDRTISDIFAVQDDVAAAIIDALQIHVGATPTRGRPTENAEAYALFLKARASLNAYEFRDTLRFVQQAIELDPKFAEIYELLANAYWYMGGTVITAAEGQKGTREAAAKALALDPDLALAQAFLASGNVDNYSFLAELEGFERAISDSRSNVAAMDALGWDLLEAGYVSESLNLAERSVELDPLSPTTNFRLYESLYAVGRTSEAVAALERSGQFGNSYAAWSMGVVNLVEGQDDSAIVYFEAWGRQLDAADSNWARDLVTGARDPATGQAHLDRHIAKIVAAAPPADAYTWQRNLAILYLVFGFPDRYYEVIFDIDLKPVDATWTDADVAVYEGTVFRRLGFTAHPRYLELPEALDFFALWEQRGPPDFCEKVGGQWVCE